MPSIVSSGMVMQGELLGDGDVQIEGKFIGRIEAANVVVSRGGTVEGDIVAKVVGVHGTLLGAIRAGSVTLFAGARIKGDILYEVLTVEPGAQLEASFRRISTVLAEMDQPAAAAPAAEEPPKVNEGPKLVVG